MARKAKTINMKHLLALHGRDYVADATHDGKTGSPVAIMIYTVPRGTQPVGVVRHEGTSWITSASAAEFPDNGKAMQHVIERHLERAVAAQ